MQCSLDVEALYTSAPVDEGLSAVQAKLSNAAVPGPIQLEDIIRLLLVVFSLTCLHYDQLVYQQIAGLPMGCSVSGIVAIVFMEAI